jgi:5-methyltetrahydropteroyltriglutamate--homocysteine methyltransferase
VAEVVAQQAACGLDVISDGEMSKPSFVTYVTERLSGFTPSPEPGEPPWAGSREVTAFPEFYSPALRQSPNAAAPRFACTGPITSALAGARVAEAFIPAISPSNVEGRQKNLYYKTDEEYLFAIAEAMREEYRATTSSMRARRSRSAGPGPRCAWRR